MPTRHAARRRVLAALALLALSNLALNALLETSGHHWRDIEFGHRLNLLRGERAAAPGRPLTVVLGSSRAQMGVNPAVLPGGHHVFVVAQSGCGPLGELVNLRRLLDAGVVPDYLVVEVLPALLADAAPAEVRLDAAKLSVADLRQVLPHCDAPSRLVGRWLAARALPWHAYRSSLISHAGGGHLLPQDARQDFLWKQMRPGGWMPYFFAQVDDERRAGGVAVAHARYGGDLARFRCDPKAERAYRELVALAASRGVRVAFMTMPESPAFRSWYGPGADGEIAACLDRIGGGPAYLAHRQDWPEAAFADGHHLLRGDADAFTRRLGAEFLQPWWHADRCIR